MLGFELSLGPVPQFPFLSIDQLCVMSWPLSEDAQPSRHLPGPAPAAQLCAVPGLIRLILLSYPRQPPPACPICLWGQSQTSMVQSR